MTRRPSRRLNRQRRCRFSPPVRGGASDGNLAADFLVVEDMRLLGRLAHLFDGDLVEIGRAARHHSRRSSSSCGESIT
jgi:hypothetical protein